MELEKSWRARTRELRLSWVHRIGKILEDRFGRACVGKTECVTEKNSFVFFNREGGSLRRLGSLGLLVCAFRNSPSVDLFVPDIISSVGLRSSLADSN